MNEKVNAYSSTEAAALFDQMVQKDTAKQVIYRDIAANFSRMRDIKGSALVVADIGCGSGHFIRQVRDIVPDTQIYYGDFSIEQVKMAGERVGDIATSNGFQLNINGGIPLQDETLDCITSHFVLSEIGDLGTALREYWRVLRPDGLFVASMTSPLSDILLAALRPDKLRGISPERPDDSQNGTYTLSNALTVPHHYRNYAEIVGGFHNSGFNLTDLDMMRYYPQPKSNSIFPLPEYLVLYAHKDNSTDRVSSLLRRLEYIFNSNNLQLVSEVLHSEEPREEVYRTYYK
jgi:ubiquinone/menaquinone biosynthesis C-methylase UbiE